MVARKGAVQMTLTLDNYKTFDNVAELNEAIRLHLREHKYRLSATAIKTLEVVSRHAVKYPGAAWLKLDTLTALIGKSAPTVRRALALLERLGIIERVAFMRPKRGGNGGNILRIVAALPADDCPPVIGRANRVEPTDSSVEQAKSASESIISLNKPFKGAQRTLQAPAPKSFYEYIQALITDKKQRREYMTAFKKQVVTLLKFDIHDDKKELLETIAVRSLYITLRREQQGNIGNSIGYFYGIMRNQIDQALFEEVYLLYSTNPNDISLTTLPY